MGTLGRATCRILKSLENLQHDLAAINVSFKMEHSVKKKKKYPLLCVMFEKLSETPYSIQNFSPRFTHAGEEHGVWLGASAIAHCHLKSEDVPLLKQPACVKVECIEYKQ